MTLHFKTFSGACTDLIYPAYEALYEIKQSDKTQTVINKVLLVITDIKKERHHLDVFALSLLDVCQTTYATMTNGNKLQRKALDELTNNVLYALADLLRSHNRSKDFDWIKNNTGKFADHYTSKHLSFTK